LVTQPDLPAERPPASDFSVSRSEQDDVAIIAVAGELDLSTAPQLSDPLDGVPSDARLLVDMTSCEFIDSTGIALLVNTARRLGAGGGALALCGARHQVLRVLQIAGVLDLMPAAEDREQALERLGQR
jgi:anti-anti-sigma factor